MKTRIVKQYGKYWPQYKTRIGFWANFKIGGWDEYDADFHTLKEAQEFIDKYMGERPSREERIVYPYKTFYEPIRDYGGV